jgi:hypothetical protein
MDQTPEQLELRIAQLKAEAEAARLQAEMLKLQAELEQAKQQGPGTGENGETKSSSTSRWKGDPAPTAARKMPEQRPTPQAASVAASDKAASASHSTPVTPKRRAKPGPAKTRAPASPTPPDPSPPSQKSSATGKERPPSAPPPLPTDTRDAGKRPPTPKAPTKETPAAAVRGAAAVAAASATTSTTKDAATANKDAAGPGIHPREPTPAEPAGDGAARDPEPVPLGAALPGAAESLSPVGTQPEQATHAQPAAEGAEDDEYEEEEEERRSWATFMLAVPSWMVSLAFHVVVVLVAALLSFEVQDADVKTFLMARAEDDEEPVLEEIVFETEQEMEEFEIKAIPTPDLSPGAADFAEITGVEAETSQVVVGLTSTDPQIGEIGTLFGTGGPGMARAGEGLSGEFFGVKATGSRFVFVVDSSMSMKSGKFEAACQELLSAVGRLTEEQSFYVIFFDWDAYRMFDLENPEPRMLRAVPPNIYRLQQWLPTVELELKTNPYDSMVYAMKLMPDAIYVLSDGEFTDKGRMVNWLKKENLVEDEVDGIKPVVTIHTIGFYTEDKGTLKEISETYGGTYRFVPRPPNVKKRPGRGRGGMPIPRRP